MRIRTVQLKQSAAGAVRGADVISVQCSERLSEEIPETAGLRAFLFILPPWF